MMKKLLIALLWFALSGLSSFSSAQTLKHSYTFDEGNANDKVGDADGTLHGGEIKNGMYHATISGNYISLPADKININQYAALTLEAFIKTPVGNATNTMMIYFGRTATNNYGADYIYFSPKNGGNTKAAISCLNTTSPWTIESNLSTTSLEDGESHHIAVTVLGSTLSLYIDGDKVSSTALSTNNKLRNISNELAYLCKGGYTADPSWLGVIDEFNIYEGIPTDEQIKTNAVNYFSAPRIISSTNGKIDNENAHISAITPVSVSTFLSSLTLPRDVTATIIDASGNPVANSRTLISDNMSLKLEGSSIKFYTLSVRILSDQNLIKWAYSAEISHESSLLANFPSNLLAGQIRTGIKVSPLASIRILDKADAAVALNHAIVSRDKVEVTAENGDKKVYTIFVDANLSKDTLITDSKATFYELPLNNYKLGNGVEWHILSKENPLPGSQLKLVSDDVWIYFPNIKPQTFNDNFLAQVTVNGVPAIADDNVRIVQFKEGCILISQGSTFQPLTVYTDQNLGGESKPLSLYTYYKVNDGVTQEVNVPLGTFDNNIESFILKKGYMASFSANSNGTGSSKIYIADKEDIVVNTMPAGLSNTVSFIRVFPWRWVNRKGYVGNAWDGNNASSQWVYCHCDSYGQQSSLNVEYVPLRHNPGWPGYPSIQAKKNITHALFYNEPDNSVDDGYSTVADAIAQYPNLLASGLRMVSPAPTDGGAWWLIDFVNQCKAKNYRLDAVAIHFYRGCQSPRQFYDFLNYIHTSTGLPVWVTEWNNGCNWSGESCIPTSYEQQAAVIKEWVDMLEEAPFVERYSIWPGCTTYQQFWSPTGITPAGQYYVDKSSRLAYTTETEHDFHYYPAIESKEVNTPAISWVPNGGIISQSIYFDKEYPPAYASQVTGGAGAFQLDYLEPNTTYYWRVDEFLKDGTVIKGQEMQFTSYTFDIPSNPSPADGALASLSTVNLSWQTNMDNVMEHKIYFGTDSTNLSLLSSVAGSELTYTLDPAALEAGQTYFWRVDDVIQMNDGTEISAKGNIWSFEANQILGNKGLNTLIYPNPAHDYIQIPGLKGMKTAEIFDISGKKILSAQTDGYLSLQSIKPGIYILFVDRQKITKFIIE